MNKRVLRWNLEKLDNTDDLEQPSVKYVDDSGIFVIYDGDNGSEWFVDYPDLGNYTYDTLAEAKNECQEFFDKMVMMVHYYFKNDMRILKQ